MDVVSGFILDILLSNEDVFVIFYIIKMMYYMYISVYKIFFYF